MKRMIGTLTVLILASGVTALSGDDPSIQGKTRTGVQQAMEKHIAENSIHGTYYIYDTATDHVRKLNFKELHKGIVKKGEYYVSCADFVDPSGQTLDLDFLVLEDHGAFKAVQAVIHKADGKKRPYHLED